MKKILLSLSLFVFGLVFSGCSLPSQLVGSSSTSSNATILKSIDAGKTWLPKIKVDEKTTIAAANILSMVMHPVDSNVIYLGTESNGLFVTKDAGETWKQIPFADKVYGLVIDTRNPNVMYGSGVFKGRAKIFKRVGEDQEWKEVYTEPADGSVISSLAISKVNPQILYAGTNEGVIIKSTNGGETWVNLKKADGPITSIVFDAGNDMHTFFAVYQVGVLETKDAGANIEDISQKVDIKNHTTSVYTLAADSASSGVIYAGTGAGIFKRTGGDDWVAINLIGSSKSFPIRAIAINPRNSREIIYASSKAIYKSIDGGAGWSTIQLDTSKDISLLRYDILDSAKIYAGLRGF